LINPKEISVAPSSSTADTVVQKLINTTSREKREVLRDLLKNENISNAVIFCNRKRDIGVLFRSLVKHGHSAAELHGDLPQTTRTETLSRFKAGDFKLLVASDVAARGLDIVGLSHVFNFDVPTSAEDYVHRIGRTGRAGKKGNAFTLAVPEDEKYLKDIFKLINKPIEVETTVKGKNRINNAGPNNIDQRLTNRKKPKYQENKDTTAIETAKINNTNKQKTQSKRNNFGEYVPPPVNSEAPKIGMGDHIPAFLLPK
jgi:superfamily II DNA/RNA helicase